MISSCIDMGLWMGRSGGCQCQPSTMRRAQVLQHALLQPRGCLPHALLHSPPIRRLHEILVPGLALVIQEVRWNILFLLRLIRRPMCNIFDDTILPCLAHSE